MINNLEPIKTIIGDGLYVITIMRMRKENPEQEKRAKFIFGDVIEGTYLEKHLLKYINMAEQFNARVYITINETKRKSINVEMMKMLVDNIDSLDKVKVSEYSVAMKKQGRDYWMIDIDAEDMEEVYPIFYQYTDIVLDIPSVSGRHLVVKPFNVAEFQKFIDIPMKELQNEFIKKKSMGVLLYI